MCSEKARANKKSEMKELLELIHRLRDDLEREAPVKDSVEWYLQNNLLDYEKALVSSKSKKEIKDSTRSLSRFCVDSLDWNSDIFRACTEITARGMRLAK